MVKPQQILELEKIIGIRLQETSFEQITLTRKSYVLNMQGQIVGLNLGESQLIDISFLSDYENLQILSLFQNKIVNLSSLIKLTNLTKLILWENEIRDITPLESLYNLTKLSLSRNKITDITPLKTLTNLVLLDLSKNNLIELPIWILNFNLEIKWKRNFGATGIFLEDNPFQFPPPEIIQQGNAAIKAYFDSTKPIILSGSDLSSTPSIDEGSLIVTKKLNELKVLFVGDGGAGKTSLSKLLRDQTFDPNENQTHGINIDDWKVGDITAHCWDFGGQEIMHATHQFFLSKRSLYILVLDGRKEEDAEYWLKHIQSFGGDSPVLVVLNLRDNYSFDVNRQHLLEKYPNIQGFYKLSKIKKNDDLKSGEAKQYFDKFQCDLYQAFTKVEILQTTWGESWFNIKTELENLTQDYINSDTYREICVKNQIDDVKTHEILAQFLHDLGILVHFADFELKDTHILKPNWITKAVYKIITSSKLAKKQGLLYLDDLTDILKKEKEEDFYYPDGKHPHIVRLMEKFELCYTLEDKKHVLIPDLLSIQQPKFELTDKQLLRFRLKYDFLPKSIMPRFIVKLHEKIQDELRWRTGVVLYDEKTKATALIRSDDHDKLIDIQVMGEQKRDFFAVIRNTLNEIHKSFEKLKIDELVPLPDNPEYTVKYSNLIGHERAGEKKYFDGELGKHYSVSELLDGIEKPEARQAQNIFHVTEGGRVEVIEQKNEIGNGNTIGGSVNAGNFENSLNTQTKSEKPDEDKEFKRLKAVTENKGFIFVVLIFITVVVLSVGYYVIEKGLFTHKDVEKLLNKSDDKAANPKGN